MRAFFRGWSSLGIRDCSIAVVVAALLFSLSRSGMTLHANGTYVEQSHRGRGLGLALWAAALEAARSTRVYVTTVSAGGEGLLAELRRRHPGVRWFSL